jgi:hypothetical protein
VSLQEAWLPAGCGSRMALSCRLIRSSTPSYMPCSLRPSSHVIEPGTWGALSVHHPEVG